MDSLSEKKQVILNSARQIILKNGLSNLVMDEVALSCGMSKKTIYEVFSGKDILIQELTVAFLQEERAIWEKEIHSLSSPEEKVRYILEFSFRAVELLPYENMTLMKKKHPQSYALIERFYEQISETLKENISAGQKEGNFDRTINPSILTQLLLQQFNLLQKNYRSLVHSDQYENWKKQLKLYFDKTLR